MGAGEHSLAQMGHLYSQLARAFDVLSGIQQPPMCTEPKEAFDQHSQDVKDGELELDYIAEEIFLALTGKKITREVWKMLRQ
jgi:hypothetical protein